MSQTVLILGGTGKIGSHASEAFWNTGWTVRQFNRKTDDMTQAAMGADVIVNGLNPAGYRNWATTIPAITAQVIAAAQASGATVIIPGNIYNFGDHPGTFHETTPQQATTRKGRIRIAMERAYRDAGVPTIVLRAGNFIDPRGNGDIMSMLMMREIGKNKITHAGNPDAMQAYAYVPDWARAAVMLAEKRNMLDTFADIPFPGHAFTARALRDAVAAATGRDIALSPFPWWLMHMLSPFWAIAYEMREMRYLYNMPHHIDGTLFNNLLPEFQPTGLERVMLAGLPDQINPNQPVRSGGQSILAK